MIGRIRLCESALPSILIAKPEPLGNDTVSVSPSSLFARADCNRAPREGWAATTRLTASAHLRCSSPASEIAGVEGAADAATSTAGALGRTVTGAEPDGAAGRAARDAEEASAER